MSILVNEDTRVLVQGITGREGGFQTERCIEYGTKVVAGCTPGRGGETAYGVPVFNTVAEAVGRQGPIDCSLIFVPAPGAADAILADLERLGLVWDGEVRYQRTRGDHYRRGLESLRASGWTFSCACSRKDYRGVYPGTCRNGLAPGKRARTRRMRVAETCIVLDDAIQGDYRQPLNESVGDFVIRRAGRMEFSPTIWRW